MTDVGKKVSLQPMQQPESQDFKGGLRLEKFGENVSDKERALFAAIDENNDGVITQDELISFFGSDENTEGIDRNSNGTVTRREAKKFIKKNELLQELGFDKKELLEFLNKAGQASEDIQNCTLNEDSEVVVTYNDGSTDRIQTDGTRINEATNNEGDSVKTTFSPAGIRREEEVVGGVVGQLYDCTTTTLYEDDGETVKNITVKDSQDRIISRTEGNTVTNTQYDDEKGKIYEHVLIDEKLVTTRINDKSQNQTTIIEYGTEVDQYGRTLEKRRIETTGDETKTYTYENGIKTTLAIKKGAITKNYIYNAEGTTVTHVSSDIDKGNGIVEHSTFSEQKGKRVTTVSIDGENTSQSVFNDNGQVERTIEYRTAQNGERATVVVIQDQESIAEICHKFGITKDEFKALNEGNSKGLKGVVGSQVNVKGELEVTDSRFDGRLSSKDAINAKNQRIYREQREVAQDAANQRRTVVMLIKKRFGSLENIARYLYEQEGITEYSETDLKVRVEQLRKLNPELDTVDIGRTKIRVAIDSDVYELHENARKTSNGNDYIIKHNFPLGNRGYNNAWDIATAAVQSEMGEGRPFSSSEIEHMIITQRIIELNPEIFNKTGKVISDASSAVIKVPARKNYTSQGDIKRAQKKADFENQYYVAAEQVFKTSVDKTGNSSIERMKKQLNSITPEYVVQFYESYNTYLQQGQGKGAKSWGQEHGVNYTTKGTFGSTWLGGASDSSIYYTICHETGADPAKRKSLCTDLFNRIVTAAQNAGVSQKDIDTAKELFSNHMENAFNESGTVKTTQMEQTTEWLIGKIHEAKIDAPVLDEKTAQVEFTGMYENQVTGAQQSFDENMKNVSWVGTFSTWLVDKVSNTTTVGEMEQKLKLEKGDLRRLKECKTEEEFKKTYEDIFHVEFNAQNISTVMQLKENMQTIITKEELVKDVIQSYSQGFRQKNLTDLENWLTEAITDPDEKAEFLEGIYCQFGDVDDASKLNEPAKINAIRKAKDAIIAQIQNEIKTLKGGKTFEQLQEDLTTLSSASFGPSNNITKEVTRFNNNINTAEMVGNVVLEIGVTMIPVGKVLSFTNKGVKAYRAYKASKTLTTATTTTKTTQVIADVSAATEASAGARFTTKAKDTVKGVLKDEVVQQSAQAGFNSGVYDYTKNGDWGEAFLHGAETAMMFEVGGAANKASKNIVQDLNITSTAGRWGTEALITGTADITVSCLDTKLIHGLDLTSEDGLMTFGMDAAFALLGSRSAKAKTKNKATTQTNTDLRGQQKQVLDAMGIRRDGQKLIADTQQGQKVVRLVNEQISQDATEILKQKSKSITLEDAETLDSHLANNCNTRAEVEDFITSLKERAGTDSNGNFTPTTSADGVEYGAVVLQKAERKLKNLDDFDKAIKILSQESDIKGLSAVRDFIGKPDATIEQLETILDTMRTNPAISASREGRKLMADLQGQIEIRNKQSIVDTANSFTTSEHNPAVVDSEPTGGIRRELEPIYEKRKVSAQTIDEQFITENPELKKLNEEFASGRSMLEKQATVENTTENLNYQNYSPEYVANNRELDVVKPLPEQKPQVAKSSIDISEKLKQLGLDDKQIEFFNNNSSEEVLNFVLEVMDSPNFNPTTDNYLQFINKDNLTLIKKLLAEPNFPKDKIALVAEAAYNSSYSKQILAAYEKGIDITRGAERIVQRRAQEKDPVVIAQKQARVDSINTIKEKTSLTEEEIYIFEEYCNITNPDIQNLIIYFENKGIEKYHVLLQRCSVNYENVSLLATEIKERTNFIIRAVENDIPIDDIKVIMANKKNTNIATMNKVLDEKISSNQAKKSAAQKKELAIHNKKNEIYEKYQNPQNKEALNRLLNNEKVSEEYIDSLSAMLKEHPNNDTIAFFEKYIENNSDYQLLTIKEKYNQWLKTPDIKTNDINSNWKVLLASSQNIPLAENYLKGLKDNTGRSIFNDIGINEIIEFSKTNPAIAKVIIAKCKENREIAAPVTLQPLCQLVKTDPDLAFSIVSMKNLDGTYRFNNTNLCDILEQAVNNPQSVKNVLSLEQIMGEAFDDLEYCINKKDFLDFSDVLVSVAGKTSISELSKSEKKNLLINLLRNKGNFNDKYRKVSQFIPTNDAEYSKIVKEITQSLNMSIKPLTAATQVEFDNCLSELMSFMKNGNTDNISELKLSMSHSDFISEIENIIQPLPQSEQRKICDHFGFQIKNGKLLGYPNTLGKDITATSIKNQDTISVLDKVKEVVEKYTNNNTIYVKDNPELSRLLNDFSKYMPEIFNQIDDSADIAKTLKILNKISDNPKFNQLNSNDQKNLILATLLHKTDKYSGLTSEAAFDAYFIAKRFNVGEEDAKKIYKIIESSDLIEKFMATSKKETVRYYRMNEVVGQARQDTFDLLAFNLKEGNTFDLAQMLYSAKEKEGLTRFLDKALKNRISEIKSADFTLPQTSTSEYSRHTKPQTIVCNGNEYNVSVVNSSEITDFYAFIHTPEAGYATGGSREANFANFNIFEDFSDDKIICTSYIDNKSASLVNEYHNGFIFEVANNKQYVGYGNDMGSLSKNIPDMIVEYYRGNGAMAALDGGIRFKIRNMVSDNLKSKLYGDDYFSLDANSAKKKSIDDDYIKRLDTIKEKLGSEPMTFKNLESIDPEFATAYRKFLSDNIANSHDRRLLNSAHHNEVIISNPKITAIFTDALGNLPEEYIIKAQKENLPIVII